MVKSGTEADAKQPKEKSMTNKPDNKPKTATEALKEWTLRQALESKPQGLPKRNPNRDTSKNGNQPVRLNPKRYQWDNSKSDRLYWERRANMSSSGGKK